MANDQNLCLFTGRLSADPDVRSTASGMQIANVRIAVGGRKKNGDKWEDTVEWVPLLMFGRTAEIAGQYLTKGSQIRVSGRFQTRKWQDKEGQDRYTTEIVVNDMQMLGSKPDGQKSRQHSEPAPAQRQGGPDIEFDDDIPF